jgi:RecB family exonuclease
LKWSVGGRDESVAIEGGQLNGILVHSPEAGSLWWGAEVRLLVGLELGGASLTAYDHLSLGSAALGSVCWGPSELLRDLELRLGLALSRAPHAVRVARFAVRMSRLAPEGRYYSRAFAVDALGTAAAMLALRDALIEAGWTGQPLDDAGERLDALQELEQLAEPELPAGNADRLVAVAIELARRSFPIYDELTLVEPPDEWSAAWRRIFAALELAGTRVGVEQPLLSRAPAETDLGRLQRALRGEWSEERPLQLHGDGSFAVIEAETSWQAAQAAAALLAHASDTDTVVIREQDAAALDNALAALGVRAQGLRTVSAWRSALQILPLALELAFQPKDPYRVLELLTLPVGPFNGFIGHALARALAQSPGIGSPAWEAVKEQLPSRRESGARAAEQLALIAEWLEAPGVEARAGAPIATLLAVLARVRDWLLTRIAGSPEDPLLLAAAQQAGALRAALESDPRATLTLIQVRQLAESVLASGTSAELLRERAGRLSYVDSPSHLRIARARVLWWSFTAPPSPARPARWRRQEADALAKAGLSFPEPGQRLSARAAAARLAFCCATERLLLVVPREQAGQALARHPLWEELLAGAQLDERAFARVTVSARQLSEPETSALLSPPPWLEQQQARALPGGHSEWQVPAEQIAPLDRFSPANLEALLGCPLQWALRYRASVRPGGHALPPLYLLNGSLGHRLVELLHGTGAFEADEASLRAQAEAQLKPLLEREGAVLLRPGLGFERAQLEQQLIRAVLQLARLLRGAGLRIVAVEQGVEAPWQHGRLEGRLDLLVATEQGEHAIIDMKGGLSTYRELLRAGRAVQLAAYAFTRTADGAPWPDAGYFSLKQGKLFGLQSRILPHAEVVAGPSLNDTWQRVERSVGRALPLLQAGRFAVTGVRGAPPLLDALGVSETEATLHFALPSGARCEYCHYDALCGRRWEVLQ